MYARKVAIGYGMDFSWVFSLSLLVLTLEVRVSHTEERAKWARIVQKLDIYVWLQKKNFVLLR